MTTVTEAQRPEPPYDPNAPLDFAIVTTHPEAAKRFVTEIVQRAMQVVPDREWSTEDLREVIEFAIRSELPPIRILEGRLLRKRLKEEIARAERYATAFSLVVATLVADQPQEVYDSIVGALEERLRRTDMVFLYRRRFAILLPHTGAPIAEKLLGRIRALIGAVVAAGTELRMELQTYPAREIEGPRAMLDWAEDRLREE
jgi:hypothetical protein